MTAGLRPCSDRGARARSFARHDWNDGNGDGNGNGRHDGKRNGVLRRDGRLGACLDDVTGGVDRHSDRPVCPLRQPLLNGIGSPGAAWAAVIGSGRLFGQGGDVAPWLANTTLRKKVDVEKGREMAMSGRNSAGVGLVTGSSGFIGPAVGRRLGGRFLMVGFYWGGGRLQSPP